MMAKASGEHDYSHSEYGPFDMSVGFRIKPIKANNNFGSLPGDSFSKNRITALDMGKLDITLLSDFR